MGNLGGANTDVLLQVQAGKFERESRNFRPKRGNKIQNQIDKKKKMHKRRKTKRK